MKHPNISIIVPVYNVEKYLPKCIDSILKQTFTEFELLLIDDGSKDLSGRICDEYAKKDTRIKVFHKSNGGVSSARNIGIEEAQGKWILFVDSDDWVESNYLDVIVKYGEDCDLLYFAANWVYSDGTSTSFHPKDASSNNIQDIQDEILLLKTNKQKHEYFGYTWNKLFKRRIITEYGIRFHSNVSYKEDDIFTTEYCRHISSLQVIKNAIYNYRVVSSGLTAKDRTPKDFITLIQCIEENITYLTNENLKRHEYLRICLGWLNAGIASNNIKDAIFLINKAYSCYKTNNIKSSNNRKINMLFKYQRFFSIFAALLYRGFMKLKKNKNETIL